MRHSIKRAVQILPFTMFIALASMLAAQSVDEMRRYGNEALQEGDAYTATYYFSEALKIDSSRADIVFLLGTAYRMSQDYPAAVKSYNQCISMAGPDSLCTAYYYLGLMQKQTGDYAAARLSFEVFSSSCNSGNEDLHEHAIVEVDVCTLVLDWLDDTSRVQVVHLGHEVNTPYSEFAPQQLGDSILYFSSLRSGARRSSTGFIPGDVYSQIFESLISPAGWQNAKLSGDGLNRGRYHITNAHFTQDGQSLIFSRCEYTGTAARHCRIFRMDRQKGQWSKPTDLGDEVNFPGRNTTQPFLLEGEEYDILYFSSDRPGGFGGSDIWYCIISDGEPQTAINLGSIINTSGNEVSPCWFGGKLYFSSDRHPGMGGLDIFSSQGNLSRWNTPVNLRPPVNSPAHDLNYTVNHDTLTGYLTSNRFGSYHTGGETCCYDIYFHETTPIAVIPVDTAPEPLPEVAEQARALLPLTLYFHNDVPDPGSRLPTTSTDYLSTLTAYAGMKSIYQEAYAQGLTGIEAQRAVNDIDTFFLRDVDGGFRKLEQLGTYILSDLRKGNSVRLRVTGFASPLTTSEYNLNLTKRRIASLTNYLMVYDNGVLKSYMNDTTDGPVFEIIAEPVGESQAAPFVSDNPNDTRNSVYSIAAALERKIEITHYDAAASLDTLDRYTRITILDAEPSYHGVSGQYIRPVLRFSNTGNTPVSISGVDSECDCIEASYPEVIIGPGESSVIYLLIRSDDPGFYETHITISTSPESPREPLPIRWIFTEE